MDAREEAWSGAMIAARRGDGAAYASFLTEAAAFLRPIVRGRLKRFGLGDGDTEDVVQDILVGLHTKRHTWDPTRPLLPWLNAITHHKLVDAIRRLSRESRRRRDVADDDWEVLIEMPVSDSDRGPVDVQRFIEALPERQRDVLDALVLQGVSVKTVADRLKTSEGVVRMTFHRALENIRRASNGSQSKAMGGKS